MRNAIHIGLILLVGVGMGLAIRAFKKPVKEAGPGPGDVVFTNDPNQPDSPIEDSDPIRPTEDLDWLSNFELTERSGKTVTSKQLLGTPYVVSFFFSTCPNQCVEQNMKVKELQDAYKGEDVKFVAITVDPAKDTPEVLREYAARFGADKEQWLFMTGDMTYIRRVGGEIFQQPIQEQAHTKRFILVDRKGEIEGIYKWTEKEQFAELNEKIREILDS